MTLNFSISELCYSDVATKYKIDNTPSIKVCDNLLLLIFNVLQPLRDKLKKSIIITSGYRCEKLNRHPEIKGAMNSQHTLGQAVDFVVNGINVSDLFNYVKNSGIIYDQLIEEHSKNKNWVHISYALKNRRENLKYQNGKYYKV